MARWRFGVHALDRTGPPRLLQAYLEWLRREHPHDAVEVIALRGGPLESVMGDLARLTVVLDPHQPLPDAADPADAAAVARAAERIGALGLADATVLVSVSAAPMLEWCAFPGPLITWVVEIEEDYRDILFDTPTRWLAGSANTARDVARRWRHHMGAGTPAPDAPPMPAVDIVPEFIAPVVPARTAAEVRAELGLSPGERLVVAAGIGTERKAPDLFVEMAVGVARRDRTLRWVWVGGADGELRQRMAELVHRRGIGAVCFADETDDLASYLAAADVMVHPARQEAFALVCLMAAAVGTPVAAFAGVGGYEEMMGPAAVAAPYPDVAQLAELVRELAAGDWGRWVGERQRQQVQQFLSPQAAPALYRAMGRASQAVDADAIRMRR